ncbi:type II toxin-antitoxin system RelE/ParE family toxin [Luteitalea sp.]|uniref:type II toxin-antitoxin system RelE/ParE family toxin n=1 Tax=Luteitalea sp. TaxID=2004800 RepID=UPI003458D49C
MPLQVVFRPQAAAEAVEVQEWYETRSSGLGDQFGEALEELVERIANLPAAFPRVHGATQRAVLRRFPYAVYFRVASGSVVVLSIHGRQHPSRWQRRR